jgi:hypothetical protein
MSSSIVSSLAVTPKADNSKGVGSNVFAIPAGAGVPVVVTPAQPQNAVTVINTTANWLRVTFTFTSGILTSAPAPTQCRLVPPALVDNTDLGLTDGGSAFNFISPIASVSIVALLTPTATAEGGTLAVATAATAGVGVLNWASA